ncbi:MAG: hypothetical protein KDH09_01195 [Chrysiogenetes bacterium]|nr:hypothetical protein [Chrysiogenetes bacterium]
MNFRTLLALALALFVVTTSGCVAVQRAKVVSPVSGDVEGPRSFDELSRQVREQSEELRLLAIRTRGLYRYYTNRYRVRVRVEEDGTVSQVDLLERDFMLPEFEDRFLEIVSEFHFDECECEPVEFVYTFEFYPEAPDGALEHAAEREKAKMGQPTQMEQSMNGPAEEAAPEEMEEPEAGMEEVPADAPAPAEEMEEPADEDADQAMPEEPASEEPAAPEESMDEEPMSEDAAAEESVEEPMEAPAEEAAPEEMESQGMDETDLEENSSPPKEQ